MQRGTTRKIAEEEAQDEESQCTNAERDRGAMTVVQEPEAAATDRNQKSLRSRWMHQMLEGRNDIEHRQHGH